MQKIKDILGVKDLRITLYLSAVSLILLAVFAVTAISLPAPQAQRVKNTQYKAATVDRAVMESQYKKSIVEIYKQYEALVNNTDTKPADIEKVKNELLSLKVPTQFKDLHLNLVMAMVKMQSYLENGSATDKELSQKAFDEVKKNNAWLD